MHTNIRHGLKLVPLALALGFAISAPAKAAPLGPTCWVFNSTTGEWEADGDADRTLGSEHGASNSTCHANASAYGTLNNASGARSSAVGHMNSARGHDSTAIGQSNFTSGSNSNAFGYFNSATATDASAFGSGNTATGA